jgi:hypothetical protein
MMSSCRAAVYALYHKVFACYLCKAIKMGPQVAEMGACSNALQLSGEIFEGISLVVLQNHVLEESRALLHQYRAGSHLLHDTKLEQKVGAAVFATEAYGSFSHLILAMYSLIEPLGVAERFQ